MHACSHCFIKSTGGLSTWLGSLPSLSKGLRMECTDNCSFEVYEKTNFTCPQLVDYCSAYEHWVRLKWNIDTVINISLVIAGCGALISYILMMMVFRLPSFNGVSYIYHKAIVVMEIVHMFVMAQVRVQVSPDRPGLDHLPFQAGLRRLLTFDQSTYSYVVYLEILRELWIIGDFMKLTTSMLTTFLSLERFIAVCIPMWFGVINRPTVAWSSVVVSILVGLLHMVPVFTRAIVQGPVGNNTTGWIVVSKTGRQAEQVGGDESVSDVIYCVKIVCCITMGIFCIGVAAGLALQSKKHTSMTSDARSKWKETRRLSILQLIIASLQIVDHVMWVADNVIADQQTPSPLLGPEAVGSLDYNTAIGVIQHEILWRWTAACSEVTGILDHATKFPLYLVGVKSFRVGFGTLCSQCNSAVQRLGGKVGEPNGVGPQ